jgi:putative transposase
VVLRRFRDWLQQRRKVRVGFALDCCDREAMTTTADISGEEVRDLMVAAVVHRFGRVNRLPVTIEWLSDNGSRQPSCSCRITGLCFGTRIDAHVVALDGAKKASVIPLLCGLSIGVVLGSRPIRWITHYNQVHPHKPPWISFAPSSS